MSRQEAEVRGALRELVSGFQICLAPWDWDLHADHGPRARGARRVRGGGHQPAVLSDLDVALGAPP